MVYSERWVSAVNGADNELLCSLAMAMLRGIRCLIVENVQDGSFEVYKAAEDGSGIELTQKGDDVRGLAQEMVCEQDRDKAVKFFEEHDKPCYVGSAEGGSLVMKALTLADGRYAFTVEGLLAGEIVRAEEDPGRDELTGVKNRAAYEKALASLNKEMSEGSNAPFAFVIAETGGIRRSKDKLSRTASEKLIRSACRLVAGTFKHSPVYRISDYEFAVLLQGYDYDIRDTLKDSLNEVSQKNERMGLTGVSSGMSVCDRNDKSAEDVAKRAMRAMQVSQRHFKALN